LNGTEAIYAGADHWDAAGCGSEAISGGQGQGDLPEVVSRIFRTFVCGDHLFRQQAPLPSHLAVAC